MAAPLEGIKYLMAVSEFITILSRTGLTFNQILNQMVLVVFTHLDAEDISMRELRSGNRDERSETWGMPLDKVLTQHGVYDLSERYPSHEILRYRRTTWISTLPDWVDNYPLFKAYPYTAGVKNFLCFPIEKSSTPVATLGVF